MKIEILSKASVPPTTKPAIAPPCVSTDSHNVTDSLVDDAERYPTGITSSQPEAAILESYNNPAIAGGGPVSAGPSDAVQDEAPKERRRRKRRSDAAAVESINSGGNTNFPQAAEGPRTPGQNQVVYPVQRLPIALVRRDADLQVRPLKAAIVAEYAEALLEGTQFPPVEAVLCNGEYLLCDGFHRCAAHEEVHETIIAVTVTQGTREDAVNLALRANATHGYRRTNADIKATIDYARKAFPLLSDRALAAKCKVSPATIGNHRRRMEKLAGAGSSQGLDTDVPNPKQLPEVTVASQLGKIGWDSSQDAQFCAKELGIAVEDFNTSHALQVITTRLDRGALALSDVVDHLLNSYSGDRIAYLNAVAGPMSLGDRFEVFIALSKGPEASQMPNSKILKAVRAVLRDHASCVDAIVTAMKGTGKPVLAPLVILANALDGVCEQLRSMPSDEAIPKAVAPVGRSRDIEA